MNTEDKIFRMRCEGRVYLVRTPNHVWVVPGMDFTFSTEDVKHLIADKVLNLLCDERAELLPESVSFLHAELDSLIVPTIVPQEPTDDEHRLLALMVWFGNWYVPRTDRELSTMKALLKKALVIYCIFNQPDTGRVVAYTPTNAGVQFAKTRKTKTGSFKAPPESRWIEEPEVNRVETAPPSLSAIYKMVGEAVSYPIFDPPKPKPIKPIEDNLRKIF